MPTCTCKTDQHRHCAGRASEQLLPTQIAMDRLALTPLEIISAPLIRHIKSRREKLLVCPHESPFINPDLEFFQKINSSVKIAFIHIGKCAGESIMTYLRCALPPESFTLFEYHCFNANILIEDLVVEAQKDPRIVIVVSIRDPLERWVASFNWDYHHVVLSTPEPVGVYMKMMRQYPHVQDLARSIAKRNQKACKYGRLHHMGMGPAWYLPESIIKKLPKDRTYIIRLENIKADLTSMTKRIAMKSSILNAHSHIHVPLTKSSYKNAYPAGTFGDLKDLSLAEVHMMKEYLQEDYRAYDQLLAMINL